MVTLTAWPAALAAGPARAAGGLQPVVGGAVTWIAAALLAVAAGPSPGEHWRLRWPPPPWQAWPPAAHRR